MIFHAIREPCPYYSLQSCWEYISWMTVSLLMPQLFSWTKLWNMYTFIFVQKSKQRKILESRLITIRYIYIYIYIYIYTWYTYPKYGIHALVHALPGNFMTLTCVPRGMPWWLIKWESYRPFIYYIQHLKRKSVLESHPDAWKAAFSWSKACCRLVSLAKLIATRRRYTWPNCIHVAVVFISAL